MAIAYPECFYSCHIFHSPHISYKNLHGATAHRLRSSEYRGLYSSVSLRLPFRPMLILLCGVLCIFYIIPLQERNQTGKACDLTPVPISSSCTSQACHTSADFFTRSPSLCSGLHHPVCWKSVYLWKEYIMVLSNNFNREADSFEMISVDASELA